MPSSSSQTVERGLDAMLLVYALLDGHPATVVCEQFIRNRTGWFTTALTLLETRAVLTKVYGVDTTLAAEKLTQMAAGPIVIAPVTSAKAVAAMSAADKFGIDLTDAVLLQTVQEFNAPWLATDDASLAEASRQLNITVEHPFDDALRQQIAAWELAHLPVKGLPRVLSRVQRWLQEADPRLAERFRNQTGGGSHLP